VSTIHLAVAASALAMLGGLAGFWLGRRRMTALRAALALAVRSTTHDQLTGVPNRAQLTVRLCTLDQQREPVVLAVVNLDRFADVNRFGHRIGDQFLVLQAARLRHAAAVNRGDIYRLGGDEFAIVWPAPPEAAAMLAGALLDAAAEPVELIVGRHPVLMHATATAGVTVLTRAAAGDPTFRLLTQADTALQHGKRYARGTATLWHAQLPVLPRPRRDNRRRNPQAWDR
jgi:diguanylate cyclase (GGDEF)-like protein